jgi:hypothetical protein
MKYFPLSPVSATGSQIKIDDYKYAGHILFTDSTDVFTIQRETSFASQTYQNIDVRVTPVINLSTGEKRGDDWKQLIFDPYETFVPTIGSLFYFDDNYWICTFTDNIKSTLLNIIIRRCNEQLRWVDDNGVIYQEPICVDYDITGTRDLVRQDDMVLPQGYCDCFVQLNTRTELVKPNQRFLFGRPKQRVCWKLFGNGIMNSQNQQTLSDTTARLMTLTMGGYQYNEQTDNLTLGIADYYKQVYSISLSASSITGNVGETYPLNATLLCNSLPTSGSLTYTTSSSTISTISSSGLLTLNTAGSTIATAYMGGNPTITASALVTVTASGTTTNEVRVTPSTNTQILEGESQTFTSYLYTNGVQQADVFTFTLANANVPVANYTMDTITNNSFKITNVNMYLDYPLLINAVSGSYTKQISIMLAGAF